MVMVMTMMAVTMLMAIMMVTMMMTTTTTTMMMMIKFAVYSSPQVVSVVGERLHVPGRFLSGLQCPVFKDLESSQDSDHVCET